MTFSVGDRVRITYDYDGTSIYVGKVGTIHDIDSEAPEYLINLTEYGIGYMFFNYSELELIDV